MHGNLNEYGDTLVENGGKGADISTQRLDDLDQQCLADVEAEARGCSIVIADIGAGRCGMSNRLARIPGVTAVAVDPQGFHEFADADVLFRAETLADYLEADPKFNVLYSQRTIHYLTYDEALDALTKASELIGYPGKIYISASGIGSELSDGYRGATEQVELRFSYLSEAMQEKHGIREPVCLYSKTELAGLLKRAGWKTLSVKASAFGNIKLVGVAQKFANGGAVQ